MGGFCRGCVQEQSEVLCVRRLVLFVQYVVRAACPSVWAGYSAITFLIAASSSEYSVNAGYCG